MLADPRPIMWCDGCTVEVVLFPSGVCPWCHHQVITPERPAKRPRSERDSRRSRAARGLVDRRIRRRADGICSACETKRAMPGRPRCSTCDRCNAPSKIVGHDFEAIAS